MGNLNRTIPLADGSAVPAYFTAASSAPGLVVIQEIFGVNANMRATADNFAALGYNVLVPDLFWRLEDAVELDPSLPESHGRAMDLAQRLDHAAALDDARAAADWLRGEAGGGTKVGVVGYCLGGNLAFGLATAPGFDAAVSYYGVGLEKLAGGAAVVTPLLIHIGGADHLCPPEAQQAIHAALDGSADVEIVDHPGAGHAFARVGGMNYQAAAAERANRATAAFLARHLAAASQEDRI